MMSNVEERVKSVTARVLQMDTSDIKLEHAFAADLGAESVQSVELVAMFEEEFGIDTQSYQLRFTAALDDDLNTPQAI